MAVEIRAATYAALRTALAAGTYQEGQAVYVETSDGSNRGAAGWGHIEASGTDNGGTTIGDGPVWVRDFDGPADVRWFGAIGDGVTDDTAAIQAAIDAAAALVSGNGTAVVVVPEGGTFVFTELVVKTGVELRGMGGVLKLANNTCSDAGTTYYPISNIGYTRSRFIDLIIDGNKANNTLFTVADAITAVGVGTVVRGCRVIDPPDSGIMFSAVEDSECSHNYVSGAPDVGIYVNDSDEVTPGGESQVVGNRIVDCVYGGIAIKRSAESIIVSANVIQECGNGITVEDFGSGTGGAPDKLVISGNVLSRIGFPHRGATSLAEVGISLHACSGVSVVGNTITECSGRVIDISGAVDCVVAANVLHGYQSTSPNPSGNQGIYVAARSGVTPSGLTVEGNSIKNVFRALWVNAATKCRFIGNGLSGSSTALRLDAGADLNTVIGNTLEGAPDAELFSGADSNVLLANTYVNGGTEWEKAGAKRYTGGATPVGVITPNYATQLLLTTSGGNKIWIATGITNTDWLQIA